VAVLRGMYLPALSQRDLENSGDGFFEVLS
jgi:hypothetical protein